MFTKEVYIKRRKRLRELMDKGLVLIMGNQDVSFNYPANIYSFRQDSTFLYFFGLKNQNLVGVIDLDLGEDYIYGNDVDMDDIIWMGPQLLIKERAMEVGVQNSAPMSKLGKVVKEAIQKGRTIHFLPPYRGETKIQLEQLVGIPANQLREKASVDLIKGVVKLRSIKDEKEIDEIDKMVNVAYKMHTTAMKMAKPGVVEQEIAGVIEGVSLSHGGPVSFPVILTINGQTLHNNYHHNVLKEGKMMVTDAGSESSMHYTSDITRTVPVGGKFTNRQKEIYEIVLKANTKAIKAIKSGVLYKDIHLMAAEIIAGGLLELGLMKGNIKEAVQQGAHAMFFPHGLGHHMGLDVHDMEGLGEDYVGYDDEVQRSDQFGLAFLRLGKRLESGNVITVEPGLYFIPALIDQWRNEGKFKDFINYSELERYKDFGGVRIEDDILVTKEGYRLLGKPIPKMVNDIEDIMCL